MYIIMKNYLPFLLIILICSFSEKEEKEVETKANDFMDYCNKHKIKAQVVYQDSIYVIRKTNY